MNHWRGGEIPHGGLYLNLVLHKSINNHAVQMTFS
jgi:hypothetical protein